MAGIAKDAVKELRDRTGVSVIECKKALQAAGGDMEGALQILRERSVEVAAKKQDRVLGAGIVATYVHAGSQVGAMVLLSCETDFVAKNEEFVALGRDIAMHAAALKPQNVEELLVQPFIKNEATTIAGLLLRAGQKFGERIGVSDISVLSVR